jgi:hypothetical protein
MYNMYHEDLLVNCVYCKLPVQYAAASSGNQQ